MRLKSEKVIGKITILCLCTHFRNHVDEKIPDSVSCLIVEKT